jgi:phosphatidylglycerophosphate synthase
LSTQSEPATAYAFFGNGETLLWGMSAVTRARKLLAKAGISKELTLEQAMETQHTVLLVRADAVFDGILINSLIATPGLVLLSSDSSRNDVISGCMRGTDVADFLQRAMANTVEWPPHMNARRPDQLQVNFKKSLVKREIPFALRLNASNAGAVEWDMFMSTYKGATDLVTKHVWPVPAFHVTRFLAAKGITPNMVTTVGAIAMFIAFYLFLYGHYWPGLIFAWLMTFLDTVDGKLARTTLTSSTWGDIFDHGIDLVHPPFWYMAWIFGLTTWGVLWPQEAIVWILSIIFGGYILQRIMEGIAIKWLRQIIHIWRPVDTWFRNITARRNPNLVILTAFMLVGKPDWGIVAVAIWVVVCLILHGIQLAQALGEVRREGLPLKSWMDRP